MSISDLNSLMLDEREPFVASITVLICSSTFETLLPRKSVKEFFEITNKGKLSIFRGHVSNISYFYCLNSSSNLNFVIAIHIAAS